MSRKLKGILGIIFSILILIFTEGYIYQFISMLGINISSYSNIVQLIINLVIKFIVCVLISMIFKKELRKKKESFNLIKSIIVFAISLIALVLIMFVFNKYVVTFIGDIFNISIRYDDFYNIFNKNINLELIIKIIKDYVMVPYLYCTVIILSSNKLCDRNNTFRLLSGLIALLVNA